jgi:hypothetical protein
MVRSPAGSPYRAWSPVAGSLLFSSHNPLCSPVAGPSTSLYRVGHPGEKPDTKFIPARCSSTRIHPLSKSVVFRRVCFKLEIELSSSPRPLWVDGFPPINRSFTRRRCIQTLATIAVELALSPRRIKASEVNLPLEGGPPLDATIVGTVVGAGATSEAAPIVFKNRPSRLPVASCPWSISVAVSGQNGYLPSSRLCSSLRIGKRSSVEWARSSPPSSAMCLPVLCSGRAGPEEEDAP